MPRGHAHEILYQILFRVHKAFGVFIVRIYTDYNSFTLSVCLCVCVSVRADFSAVSGQNSTKIGEWHDNPICPRDPSLLFQNFVCNIFKEYFLNFHNRIPTTRGVISFTDCHAGRLTVCYSLLTSCLSLAKTQRFPRGSQSHECVHKRLDCCVTRNSWITSSNDLYWTFFLRFFFRFSSFAV